MASRCVVLALGIVFGFRLVAGGGAPADAVPDSFPQVAEHSHHSDGPTPAGSGEQAPCTTADAIECCGEMDGLVMLGAGPAVATADTLTGHAGRIRQQSVSLVSRPHAPDPPPPKS